MGENKVVVYVVVGFFCIAAAALAFAAEATRIKESNVEITTLGCKYPNTPAYILGYVAAVLLVITQIIISVVTRCACCQGNTPNSGSSTGGIICFVISWVASVIGIALLVSAANLSSRHEYFEEAGYCYFVKAGVFAAGGGLAIAACILGLWAYRCSSKDESKKLTSTTANQYNNTQSSIVMGTPQFSVTSENPYTKQQHFAV